MPRRPLTAIVLCAAACRTGGPEGSGFGTTPGGSSPGSSSSASSSTSGEGSTSSSSSNSGSSAPGSSGPGATTEPLRDVGAAVDAGSPQPAGCQGKIDFLFLISRQGFMAEIQTQLIDAFPKFIETIESKFADFDYHIMVVDGDAQWGLVYCTEQCPDIGPPPCVVPDYPCDLLDQVTTCDETQGAGVVFNAGALAANKPCHLPGGRRFLVKGDPNLADTFACMAQGGMSGGDRLGDSLTAAMSPALREGCNAGFLRDDALLMLTIVTATSDLDSQGTPEAWAQAAFDAKGGDPDAIVTFGIVDEYGPPWCDTVKGHPMCEMIRRFPYHSSIDCDVPDYGPGFDAASDLVAEACASFIPG